MGSTYVSIDDEPEDAHLCRYRALFQTGKYYIVCESKGVYLQIFYVHAGDILGYDGVYHRML